MRLNAEIVITIPAARFQASPNAAPPADARAASVCLVDEKPQWVVATAHRKSERKCVGVTGRALQRARKFVAEEKELNWMRFDKGHEISAEFGR